MAVLKGIKEKVHLPLYDSLFVRPGKQLRDVESSSVLKFFVNLHGKTKLETNMQSASLLPHWNTFEARALRVVVSDLPARFPQEINNCLTEPGAGEAGVKALTACIDQLSGLIVGLPTLTQQEASQADELLAAIQDILGSAEQIRPDYEQCVSNLGNFRNREMVAPMLEMQRDLKGVRAELIDVLSRTKIELSGGMRKFINKLEAADPWPETEAIPLKNREVDSIDCTGAFNEMLNIVTKLQEAPFVRLQNVINASKQFISRAEQLTQVKQCLLNAEAGLKQYDFQSDQLPSSVIARCLGEKLLDKRAIPVDEQLAGKSQEILSKFIYNTVTTFFVGEKVMMQMPTWFFPSGAGPFSEDGKTVTHGIPAPEATFRFAEPVSIDTQQNFRVEIEIPEAASLNEIQRIYGPFFIWVALDGYMRRDVQ
ncbi:MAG TPA: hypothetical protein VKA70_06110 [Blastocatellia bacterium]|nr:hypothetical protein [Blastocatellia bacterium]